MNRRDHMFKPRPARLASAILLLCCVRAAPGQCPSMWQPGDPVAGVNGPVYALTTWDDGGGAALYAGGQFSVAGDVTANNIAKWDGTRWWPLADGTSGKVNALAVWNGSLVAGGSFTTAGGLTVNGIALWDGQAWSDLSGGMPVTTSGWGIRSLAVFQGDLIAAGFFSVAGASDATNIARWDGAQWWPLADGLNSTVLSLCVYDNELMAGGAFTATGGVGGFLRIARWNGSAWSQVGSGFDFTVEALGVFENDLIAGGTFDNAGGTPARGLARWNGSSWSDLGTGNTQSYSITSFAVLEGDLIVGGYMQLINDVPVSNIARWNGMGWSALDSGIGQPRFYTRALAVFDGRLIAGGNFTRAGEVRAYNIAAWDGAAWSALNPGSAGIVRALAVHDGHLVAGRDLNASLAPPAGRIDQLDTSVPGNWVTLGETDGPVRALASYQGDLIAGGDFLTIDGVAVNHIARWDGTDWHALDSGLPGQSVRALLIYSTELIVGGAFNEAGGVLVSNIARWNATSWSALGGVGSGVNGTIEALELYGGGVVAGGAFTTADGVQVNRVAFWDGTAWSALGNGVGSRVLSLTVFNGELLGGGFNGAAPSPNKIVRWDGNAWSELSPALSGNSAMYALAVYAGELYAGGYIWPTGGDNAIARWNGAAWEPLGAGLGGGSGSLAHVYALEVFDGHLVAGGDFTLAGGEPSAFVARWGPGEDADGNGTPDPCEGAPAASILSAVSRKNCDLPLPLSPDTGSEPRIGGVSQVRIVFDISPGGPGESPVIIEEKVCPLPAEYVPYMGVSTSSAVIEGNELVLTFTPALENARTYRLTIGPEVTNIAGQSVEMRGLIGDVNSDGFVNALDRGVLIGAWTGAAGFTCLTDLNNDGSTNALDRGILIGAWTGAQNCAP